MSDTIIQIDASLESADRREGYELHSVLQSALKSRAVFEREHRNDSQIFWPAKHFNLDRVTIFRDASEAEREQILEGCCRDLLEEAYWIEKCGMYFAAKMSLMASSTEERMLYSLFAADEAVHFSWISGYVPAERVIASSGNPFHKTAGRCSTRRRQADFNVHRSSHTGRLGHQSLSRAVARFDGRRIEQNFREHHQR